MFNKKTKTSLQLQRKNINYCMISICHPLRGHLSFHIIIILSRDGDRLNKKRVDEIVKSFI